MKRVRTITLIGLTFVTLGCSTDPTKIAPARQGSKGETCLNTNDCKSPLACIRSICTDSDFAIAVGAKVCLQIDCAEKADCCEPLPAACSTFEADYATYCEPYTVADCSNSYDTCTTDAECTQAGETCDSTLQYCSCTANPSYDSSNDVCFMAGECTPCSYECTDERCVPACATDDDCPFNETCNSSHRCVECSADSDCLDSDQKCLEGRCMTGCSVNEHCPLFNTCNSSTGECEYAGCTDDHECQFAFSADSTQNLKSARCAANPRAGLEGEPARVCKMPCESDAECERREVCSKGTCVYMGCESNEECRAELGFATLSSAATFTPQAVCREP